MIILIVVILSIYIYKKQNKGKTMQINELIKKEKTYDKLVELGYNSSGNMRGNFYEARIDVEKKILTLKEKNEYYQPLNVKEYSLSDKDIKDLLNDIDKYNLPEWKCLEYDLDNVELDGPSRSIFFVYDNSKISKHRKDWYTIDLNSKVSDKGHEVLRNFRDKIINLMQDDNLVNEYVEEEEK